MTDDPKSRAEKLLLLDTASLYFRAFHGVPDSFTAPDGTPVNAVRGLLDMIAKLSTRYRPTHLVACWDDDWRPSWRVDLVPTYKAHRVVGSDDNGADLEDMPRGLQAQLPLIRTALETLGIPIIGAAGYEADDVIGTLATRARMPVDIVTGDRDLLQLIDDARRVRVVYTARGMSNLKEFTDRDVFDAYGVYPRQYADFATLRGDASDGLPGVRGIGDKTAAALLHEFDDLAGIRAAAQHDGAMSPALRKKISDASAYLDRAPQVVAVARSLDLDTPSQPLAAPDAEVIARAVVLGDEWNLQSPLTRLTAALTP